jgi:cell wall-associated NlpC family hydrolase
MGAFDPRLTPARADLAARTLEGKVEAPRYVDGRVYEVIEPQAALRAEPKPDAPLSTEALKGERVMIYDVDAEGWAWGQLAADGYVGWLPANALVAAGPPPTHKVAALRTLAFPGRSIKQPPIEALPLGARLHIVRIEDRMAVTRSGAYVPHAHLVPLDSDEADFVAVAERFVGVPYLWGGKTALGLDCSGLVQVALTACGIFCPRDSDMQERALGSAVADPALPPHAGKEREGTAAEPKRGDLIFWQGHVAIVRDDVTLIHANAFHMAVTVEPIADAVARIRESGTDITSVRRFVAESAGRIA